MRTTRLKTNYCPVCNKKLDAASHEGSAIPTPGDYSVCVKGKTWLRFTEELSLRVVTQEDIDAMTPIELEDLKQVTAKLGHIM